LRCGSPDGVLNLDFFHSYSYIYMAVYIIILAGSHTALCILYDVSLPHLLLWAHSRLEGLLYGCYYGSSISRSVHCDVVVLALVDCCQYAPLSCSWEVQIESCWEFLFSLSSIPSYVAKYSISSIYNISSR
jgi:hypothetical protein